MNSLTNFLLYRIATVLIVAAMDEKSDQVLYISLSVSGISVLVLLLVFF